MYPKHPQTAGARQRAGRLRLVRAPPPPPWKLPDPTQRQSLPELEPGRTKEDAKAPGAIPATVV